MTIEELNNNIQKSVSDSIYKEKRVVFGDGNVNNPIIMLIGEAPGGNEEKEGKPFVGAAGKNLNEFLDVLELVRSDIYISNVVKIRPTKINPKTNNVLNRTPDKDEIAFFCPFLYDEIRLLQPKIIVTLGNTPLNAVLNKNVTVGNCHGKLFVNARVKIFPLYHPAAVIYNASLKDTYLDDLRKLKIELGNIK